MHFRWYHYAFFIVIFLPKIIWYGTKELGIMAREALTRSRR